jgi:hypothetical protein
MTLKYRRLVVFREELSQIARLSDRAAYATGDEYAEIRTLMTALKAVLAPQA